MKSIICVLIFMLLSGCMLSEEISRDTVLKEVRITSESPLTFLEDDKNKESKNENLKEKKEKQAEKAVLEESEKTLESQRDKEKNIAEESGETAETQKDEGKNTLEESGLVAIEEKRKQEDKKAGTGSVEYEETVISQNRKKTVEEFTDEVKAALMRKQQELYAYSTLEITEQNIYVEILYALENYIEEMEVSTKDTSEIDKVFQCVLMDHPELFYTDGYSFVKYTLGDSIQKITFKGTYSYGWEDKERLQEQIKTAAIKMLKNLPADASDYEKVKYVYETVIEQTKYSLEAPDNQNVCSVFLGQASVCQGYAKAVQYLLQMLKVPTALVMGTVETGEGHAWNIVKINNEYYYVDATWGDASYLYQTQNEMESKSASTINYDYLCVTTEEILQTHSMSEIVPLPVCDSLEANYYVREGAYFTEVNWEQISELIYKYKQENRESVTLKCADNLVYQKMAEELLGNQKIFNYLESGNNSIVYTDSEKQRSLTFWF